MVLGMVESCKHVGSVALSTSQLLVLPIRTSLGNFIIWVFFFMLFYEAFNVVPLMGFSQSWNIFNGFLVFEGMLLSIYCVCGCLFNL